MFTGISHKSDIFWKSLEQNFASRSIVENQIRGQAAVDQMKERWERGSTPLIIKTEWTPARKERKR